MAGPDKRSLPQSDRKGLRRSTATVGGILLGLMLLVPVSAWFDDGEPTTTIVEVPVEPIMDPADPFVGAANLEPALVQWGTTQPYAGQGPPGIRLTVRAPGDIVGWIVEGWANATSPPPTPVSACSENGVHFDRNDWVYRSDSVQADSSGTFETIPSTVPQRLTPNGDQCHLRIEATGPWRVTVCIEGAPVGDSDEPGLPHFYYHDSHNHLHYDPWDACVERLFQV